LYALPTRFIPNPTITIDMERFKIVRVKKINGLGESEDIWLLKERVLWFFWYTIRHHLPHDSYVAEFSSEEQAQKAKEDMLKHEYRYVTTKHL